MQTEISRKKILVKIRITILFFMAALIVSGVTAFPIETELHWLIQHPSLIPEPLNDFIHKAYDGISNSNQTHPMLAYGYDWLAFAHIVIAMAFIGPLRDPVKNIWIIEWAMLACIAVIPLALIAGPIRGIPFYWLCIDCSFGVFGIIPLWIVRRWIRQTPPPVPLKGELS
jgi:hypothetical protein